jgi:hypothetical protein
MEHTKSDLGSTAVALSGTKPILTLGEVATHLRCSKAHVSNILNGRVAGVATLPHFALGRRKLVRSEWLNEWIERNQVRC